MATESHLRRQREWLSIRRGAVDHIIEACALADNEVVRSRISGAIEEAMVGAAMSMVDVMMGATEQVAEAYDRRRVDIGPAAGANDRRRRSP